MSHLRVGEAQERLGHAPEALAALQQGLPLFEALVAADPRDVRAQRDLSTVSQLVGDAHVALGHKAEALASFQRSIGIEEVLAKAEPDNLRARRDLSLSYMRLADGQRLLQDFAGALGTLQKCLAIDETRAQAHPDNPQLQRDLGCTLGKFGIVYAKMASDAGRSRAERMGHWREAREWLERALKQFAVMKERGLLGSSDQHLLQALTKQIEACKKSLGELTAEEQKEQAGPP
jgi:tetratricopeptide (TPR) repeat protein